MDLIGGIHDSLSLHLLTPFSRLQRSTRPATRPTQQAFNEGLRFRRETATWDDQQRLRWTEERLRSIVRQAYEETVFYRELYDRNNIDVYADFTDRKSTCLNSSHSQISYAVFCLKKK